MNNGLCSSGSWGSLGNIGEWGWIGLVLMLLFWVGSFAGLTLLVVWAVRRARVHASITSPGSGQPSARENLQVRYARGEITREQYELKKQEI